MPYSQVMSCAVGKDTTHNHRKAREQYAISQYSNGSDSGDSDHPAETADCDYEQAKSDNIGKEKGLPQKPEHISDRSAVREANHDAHQIVRRIKCKQPTFEDSDGFLIGV